MEFKDYYQVLGVPKSASEKDIKQAYRKLARENHPDVHAGDKGAERRFQEINEAYEVLSDSENRKKYDQLGSRWRQSGPQVDFGDIFSGGGGHSGGFSNFFERFFGGAGPRRGPGPGASSSPPEVVEVEVSLAECFQGGLRQLELSAPVACSHCRGAGVAGQSLCPACRGAGRISGQRKLEVRIPAGVTHGSRVKAQDVLIQVNVRPDPDFELKGRDLIRKVPVDLYGAILGCEIKFKTPQDKEVALKVPPESQNGRSFRLSGQGLPGAAGKAAGDLYIKLEVQLPSKLSLRERELFQELARLRQS